MYVGCLFWKLHCNAVQTLNGGHCPIVLHSNIRVQFKKDNIYDCNNKIRYNFLEKIFIFYTIPITESKTDPAK